MRGEGGVLLTGTTSSAFFEQSEGQVLLVLPDVGRI